MVGLTNLLSNECKKRPARLGCVFAALFINECKKRLGYLPLSRTPTSPNLLTEKCGKMFWVGIFLDFVRLAARTMHPRGACVRGAERHRIDRARAGPVVGSGGGEHAVWEPAARRVRTTGHDEKSVHARQASSKNFLLNQVDWEPGGGCIPEWLLVRVLPLDHQRWWRVGGEAGAQHTASGTTAPCHQVSGATAHRHHATTPATPSRRYAPRHRAALRPSLSEPHEPIDGAAAELEQRPSNVKGDGARRRHAPCPTCQRACRLVLACARPAPEGRDC